MQRSTFTFQFSQSFLKCKLNRFNNVLIKKILNNITQYIILEKEDWEIIHTYGTHTYIYTYWKFYWELSFTYSIPQFYYGNCSCKHRFRSETAAASNSDAVFLSRGKSDHCETWLSDRGPLYCVIYVVFCLEKHSILPVMMLCCSSCYPPASHALSCTLNLDAGDKREDNDRCVP